MRGRKSTLEKLEQDYKDLLKKSRTEKQSDPDRSIQNAEKALEISATIDLLREK